MTGCSFAEEYTTGTTGTTVDALLPTSNCTNSLIVAGTASLIHAGFVIDGETPFTTCGAMLWYILQPSDELGISTDIYAFRLIFSNINTYTVG